MEIERKRRMLIMGYRSLALLQSSRLMLHRCWKMCMVPRVAIDAACVDRQGESLWMGVKVSGL